MEKITKVNNTSALNVMARLVTLIRPLTGYMFLAVLTGLIGNLSASFITIAGGYAILTILNYDFSLSLNSIFLLIGIFGVSRGFLRYAEQSLNHYIAFKLLALIRDKVFKALRKLSPAKLEGRDKGNLISIITSDIELLEVFYAHTVSPIMIAVLNSAAMSIFIGAFHWSMGILALFAYAVIGIIVPLTANRLGGDNGLKLREKAGDLSSFVLESMRGLNETLQYGNAQKRLKEMLAKSDELSIIEKRMKRAAGINAAATNTIIMIFIIAMLSLSIILYKNGLIGFDGTLISVIALMSSFGTVTALANLGSTLQHTIAAGNRVLDILDETPVTEEVNGMRDIVFSGAEANKISFAYKEDTILNELSIKIPLHSIIGIIGESGSGKSTLLKLLMRFWDVDKGDIKISGEKIQNINTVNLREMESYITQQTHLFRDSIINNLKIANQDATFEQMVQACRKASIHDFIMSLPKGYNTNIGELGDTLSSGEKQRIGLAMAFLHDAPFLLLDEPTSSLDSLNEAIILKSLDKQRKGKTMILVSHRQSTMRIADDILIIKNGSI